MTAPAHGTTVSRISIKILRRVRRASQLPERYFHHHQWRHVVVKIFGLGMNRRAASPIFGKK
jgi:hypothetical protein